MEELFRFLMSPDPILPWQVIALSLLLAFVASVGIAWIYVKTHRGISYSRSFVQALVLGGMTAAVLMLAVGNNVARGIGLVGTLAIIRFRSTMKDPRDMIFVFATLAVGIAMGARAFATGLIGVAAFGAAAWLLDFTEFGTYRQHDGLLRFQVPVGQETEDRLKAVLGRHCRSWVLIALREVDQGVQVEHNYHVKLLDPDRREPLVSELESVPGIRGVSLFLQGSTGDM